MSENRLSNIELLKDDMKEKGMTVSVFDFSYRNKYYYVLVNISVKLQKNALAKLDFLKMQDEKIIDKLSTEANRNNLCADVNDVRVFFEIKRGENWGELFSELYRKLNAATPVFFTDELQFKHSDILNKVFSKNDSQDPRKIYCTRIREMGRKENGDLKERSEFNSKKTKDRYPDLYENFADKFNVCFDYSTEKEDEKTEKQIIENFRLKQQRKLHRYL